MSEIIKVEQAELLQAINKSEIDMQIATAKQYPRDVEASLAMIETLGTMDDATAQECFYVLHRNNGQNIIEGLSVRMAEIIADCWGNLRVQTRIIGNDGKTITAQGICHDLQSNVAVSVEVKRSIRNNKGATYSEEMQVVTGNAASAVAFRNAVLKVVPKAVTKRACQRIKDKALGVAIDVHKSWQDSVLAFQQLLVTEAHLLYYLGINSKDEVTAEHIQTLRGSWTAIKEGTATAKELFIEPYDQAQKSKEVASEAKNTKDFIGQMMNEAKA